jgi:hypothetical protein
MVTDQHGFVWRHRATTVTLLTAALLTAALWGCAPAPCEPPSCDVRDKSCRRDVMAATACLRGEQPREVRTRVVRVEDYVGEQEVDQDQVEHFEAVAGGWALLGLQREQGYADVLAAFYDTVGAFYDTHSDTVTILHRGSPLDSDWMVALLVHEFSHALQHDAVDDDGPPVVMWTTDARLGRSAIFEGDATRTTDQALMRMFGADPKGPDWGNVYEKWSDTEGARYADEPLRITLAGRYFVYAFGAAFVERVAAGAGNRYLKQIHTWMKRPPLSTSAVLAGPARASGINRLGHAISDDWVIARSVPEAGAPPSSTDAGVPDAAKVADAGSSGLRWRGPDLLLPLVPAHRLLDADSIGKFVLDSYARYVQGLLGDTRLPHGDLQWATQELLSDSLTVWQAEQRTVVIFRAQFSFEWPAQTWRQGLDRVNPGRAALRTHLDGDTLIVISSNDDAWLSEFTFEELQWQRFSPKELAWMLYPDASTNAAQWAGGPETWKSRLNRGCVRHPGATFFADL